MEETDRKQTANTGNASAGGGAAENTKPVKHRNVDKSKPGKRGSSTAKQTAKGGKRGAKAGGAKKAGSKKAASGGRQKQKLTTQTIVKSFGHAFDGIFAGMEERNMKIHCTMAALVVFFGLILHISVTEWCICLVLFGLIMGLELANTAIEALCDLVTQEYRPLAKRAKDTAAGAVLIASIMAAAAGLIIFIPRLLYVLKSL